MSNYQKHIIPHSTTIREALVLLNGLDDSLMILFITDVSGIMRGTITDGDIRRALINGISVDSPVESVMFRDFRSIREGNFNLELFHKYKSQGINLLPVLDKVGCIIGIRNLANLKSMLPVDVVIMAGGEGQRLRPLTEKTPKPLLVVGSKPILEHNIDRLIKFGVQHIHITLRYLGEQIADYFGDGSSKGIHISYVYENQILGTFGAVGLVEELKNENVLVMNSDLLTNIDYEDFYRSFVDTRADMLIAAVPYQVNIPYAVLETTNGKVERFVEKPTYTYHSNAGIYMIRRDYLMLIDGKEKLDATDFMQQLIESNKNVQTYPLLQYWLDIGKHDDFEKAQETIKHLAL